MRIALNGQVASGKTTLGRAIAEKYSLPFIEEGLGDIFKWKRTIQQLRENQAAEEEITEVKRRWIRSFLEWKEKRAQLYQQHREFVADRWEADLLDIWLFFWAREPKADNVTVELHQNFHDKARLMDLVVLLPFGEPFTRENSTPTLKRNTRFSTGLLNWTVLNGLISSVPDLNVLRIQDEVSSLDQRLALVGERIDRVSRASR